MMRQTEIAVPRTADPIGKEDALVLLGSCFSSYIADILAEEGYSLCSNPFGTLFNPVSIADSLERLADPRPFTEEDCVELGAGSRLWGSFHHYTRCARGTKEEFLRSANSELAAAAAAFKAARTLVLTFGTAFCFRHIERDMVVANCLKRNQSEFERFRLDVAGTVELYKKLIPTLDKRIIFTVSPVRHLADGAHGNAVSKSVLLLAVDELVRTFPDRCFYFPAYEILMDELRDFRWYEDDTVHPSAEARAVVWRRFRDAWLG
ncbi:MAG: GSCFA domain-containing protein [Bacteroidales bacterium]|nr:GSCFA domain-containing protein [Bacteroidales bacterium]